MANPKSGLSKDNIGKTKRNIDKLPILTTSSSFNKVSMNAILNNTIDDICLDRKTIQGATHIFSNKIRPRGKITDQKQSGRCWLFAGLNVLRNSFIEKYNLGTDFEFSQNYLFFWDKIEKVNYFFDLMVRMKDKPMEGRLMAHLLHDDNLLSDGGQWEMFANLIRKYGVIPKSLYGESVSSCNTSRMNELLMTKMREYVALIRECFYRLSHGYPEKETEDKAENTEKEEAQPRDQEQELELEQEKTKYKSIEELRIELLQYTYDILCTTLGEPPKPTDKFVWEYYNVDKQKNSMYSSPLLFYQEVVPFDCDDYICIINDPRKERKYKKCYTLQYMQNIVEGKPIRYINLEMKDIKPMCIKMIQNNLPIWFGCDDQRYSCSKKNLMDINMYDYDSAFGTSFRNLQKEDRIRTWDSVMSHAMVINGFDAEVGQKFNPDEETEDSSKESSATNTTNDKPSANKSTNLNIKLNIKKWRVENSWGNIGPEEGYMTMMDNWFDEYVFEVVIHRDQVPPKYVIMYDEGETQAIPVWDQMGSLAK